MFDILLRILRSQLYSELYSSFFVLFLWTLFSLPYSKYEAIQTFITF